MLVCVQLNPTLDRILEVPGFAVGETLRAEQSVAYPLGKAISVACAVKTLGTTPLVVSLIGEKEEETYAQFLHEKQIPCHLVPVNGKTRSNVTIIDPLNVTTTHIRDRGFTPPPEALNSINAILQAEVGPESIVAFSGSLPPQVPENTYATLLEKLPPCKAQGLDTSGPALQAGMGAHPSVVKPNLEELHELFPDAPDSPDDVQTLLPFVDRFRETGVAVGAITLGNRGSLLWDSQTVLASAVEVPRVVDTVGCGDSFLAGMLVGILRDWDLDQIARVATAAAGANAMTAGAGLFLEEDFKSLRAKVQIEQIA
ncbi:MAG TPA: hexose kinase [Candidatus Lokiarchaeia archaeon]|nr:hexose kinase [Candidatus Lokiarchaeia archaeon]